MTNTQEYTPFTYTLREWIDPNKLDWKGLSKNPYAVSMLEKNYKKINWTNLSSNPNAMHLLEKTPSRINWKELSRNPNAIHLLKKRGLLSSIPNADQGIINWYLQCQNSSEIHLLEQNIEKIDWWNLSKNPYAIDLLEKNYSKISWFMLSSNPSIFKKTVNYKYLKERMDIIREELMMKCMHPSRLERFLEMGGEIDGF
jgi:hypothetical protein